MAGPQHVSHALAELIALKGLARVQAHTQLQSVWSEIAGEQIAAQTKVLGVRRDVLQISVTNSALLSELVSFHKQSLVEALRNKHADLRVKDIKFRLKGKL